MITSKVVYQGELRTIATHLKSGESVISDAPTDNYGKGEAFSPTDFVATALAQCMLTVMGIRASKEQFHFGEPDAEVIKHMEDDPRRIGKIEVEISFNRPISEKWKKVLKTTALNCPVAKSLSPEIEQEIRFNWNS